MAARLVIAFLTDNNCPDSVETDVIPVLELG
jgi:hypothetical protein